MERIKGRFESVHDFFGFPTKCGIDPAFAAKKNKLQVSFHYTIVQSSLYHAAHFLLYAITHARHFAHEKKYI